MRKIVPLGRYRMIARQREVGTQEATNRSREVAADSGRGPFSLRPRRGVWGLGPRQELRNLLVRTFADRRIRKLCPRQDPSQTCSPVGRLLIAVEPLVG